MFGIMDTNTGKIVENAEIQVVEDFYTYTVLNNHLFAVPKEYINTWESGQKCEQEGCYKDGCVECHVPDESYHDIDHPSIELVEYFCCDHDFKNGYCIVCGEFTEINSFDFLKTMMCEGCRDELEENDDGN